MSNSSFFCVGSGSATLDHVVVPSALGGLVHATRNRALPSAPWQIDSYFGAGDVSSAAIVESPGGTQEVFVRAGDRVHRFERVADAHQPDVHYWIGPLPVMVGDVPLTGVRGNPTVLRSRFGANGNYELVVPMASGGLRHLWRDNDHPNKPWNDTGLFLTSLGVVDAVALVHGARGSPPGDLEALIRVGADLFHASRQAVPPYAWTAAATVLAGGAAGVPSIVESSGTTLVAVTPSSGALTMLTRDGDAWSGPASFGGGGVNAVGLVKAPGGDGRLELVARLSNASLFFSRAGVSTPWSGPATLPLTEPLGDPSAQGEWRVPFSAPVVGIHAVVLHTGNVLLFAYKEHEDQQLGDSAIVNPVSGEYQRMEMAKNPFCAGQAVLPDGRAFIAGGNHTGVGSIQALTPAGAGGTWQDLGNMAKHRWYPTCCVLPHGRLFITAGDGGGPRLNQGSCTKVGNPLERGTYEIFDPASGLQPVHEVPVLNTADPYWLYPFVFVLPSGRLLIHAGRSTQFFDPANETFSPSMLQTVSAVPRTYPVEGTAVLLPLLPDASPAYAARILLMGGGGIPCPHQNTPATATCEMLDLSASSPAWAPAPSMAHPRVMPDAVLLPDGTVLVVNGSRAGVADDAIDPVYAAELYNPKTNSWTTLASMRVPRLYHATALLLPDGRVMTTGTDAEFNPHPFHRAEYRLEVFSPPYLFKGPRPTIAAAPAQVGYHSSFTVQTPDAGMVSTAAVMRPGAVTHSFNQEQRHVGLSIQQKNGGSVTLSAPPSPSIAPPGFYMLFLVSDQGVPSGARFVKLV
jgi:hypothetical protein